MNEAQARQTSADELAANINPERNLESDPFAVGSDPFDSMNQSRRDTPSMNESTDRSGSSSGRASSRGGQRQGRSSDMNDMNDMDDMDDMDDRSDLEQSDWDDESEIGERAVQLLSRVRRRIREQPLRAAGGAFLVGFAFGNGVPKFLARAGIAIGLRMVMERMLERADVYEGDN